MRESIYSIWYPWQKRMEMCIWALDFRAEVSAEQHVIDISYCLDRFTK